jgi:hypothetical protein
MKKIFVSFLMVGIMAIPVLSFAADTIMPSNNPEIGRGLSVSMVGGNIPEILSTVANYVIGILLIVAVFYVIWAAYTFMTSNGEPDKVATARMRIMYAGIGVVVALLAKGIISLVISALK